MKNIFLVLSLMLTFGAFTQTNSAMEDRAKKQVAKITAQISLGETDKKTLYNECLIFQKKTAKLRSEGKKISESEYNKLMVEARQNFYSSVLKKLSNEQHKAQWTTMNKNLLTKK